MPEAPEAQTLVDNLNELTKDRWIVSVEGVGGRYITKPIPGLTKEFIDSSHPIDRIYRHGKAIVFDLASRNSIVITLGMTGKFSLEKEKHAAAEFLYGDAYEKKKFYFVDQRRFGTVRIIPRDNLKTALPNLGWDALSQKVDVEKVRASLDSCKEGSVIGTAMMDGSVFSGIGNYLRAEILYAAGVSPWKKCSDLTDANVEAICSHARRICLRSYELGGNTIENFVSVDGQSGGFYEELKVYGKRNDPDGHPVIAEKTPEGRTIHWCPAAQT